MNLIYLIRRFVFLKTVCMLPSCLYWQCLQPISMCFSIRLNMFFIVRYMFSLVFIDTVKAYLEKNKIGKYNKEEMEKREQERRKEEEAEETLAKSINPNDRCLIKVLGQPERRGSVKFVGK